MEMLTRWVLSHRSQVVVVWLILMVTGGVTVAGTIERLSSESRLPGQPAQLANDVISERFGGTGGRSAPLLLTVTVPEGVRVDSAPYAGQWNEVVARATPSEGRSASYSDAPALLSRDGRTTVALIYPRAVAGPAPYTAALPGIQQAIANTTIAGEPVKLTGLPVLSGRESGAARSPIVETLIGAVGALIVLVAVFASGLAVVPLLMAAVTIPTTFLLVRLLTGVTDVSFIVQYLVALIGLGIAIDYTLLVVTRWREERAGLDDTDPQQRTNAIVRAAASAGRAVALSGITVAISLAALIVLPVPFLRSIGYAGLLIPLVSVAVALTLLPVLLYSWGHWLDQPRRRHHPDSGLWTRIARGTTRRPLLSALVSGALLVALAGPALAMRLGQPDIGTLGHGGPPAAAYAELVRAGFGAGIARPVEVLVQGDTTAVANRLRALPGVAAVVTPDSWSGNGYRLIDAWTLHDPADDRGRRTVAAIVTTVQAQDGAEAGGGPPLDADFVDAVYGSLPVVLLVVALLTFVVLARSLRSILLPLKALALTILSTSAAYGVVVLIWQKGYGSQTLFNTPATGAITIWVPMAVFAFLFGLSMDYEVFILHRIREVHTGLLQQHQPKATVSAVVTGISRTGRLVTSAALILFLAFTALATIPVTDVKILATALAAGIAIDATLVRGVLTPALVALLGRASWWFPTSAARFLLRPPTPDAQPRIQQTGVTSA
ncbi:MMPL family transporter [Micromonospora arborensis]|uniref:MMPL family transporter n=1 Tax=Micromonospora arborensis TaxID=2116518 RepID=UPI0033D79394